MRSYGIYTKWNANSKKLPRIQQRTTVVPATVGIEFGFVVNIKRAKNRQLAYCIDHPGILGEDGVVRAPFDGVEYVQQNDWDFYLGDTIWEPLHDKLGDWHMSLELDGKVIAEKTFNVIPPGEVADP